MLAYTMIAAVALGLDGEQQAALDALIAQRQQARIDREAAAAELRRARMWDFYTLQTRRAKERKIERQDRLVSLKSSGRTHWPTSNLLAMQRAVIGEAYRRQSVPVQSAGQFYGFDRR